MKLKTIMAIKNECYKKGKKHTVKGLMLHSTGANNPNAGRYVQPDDGLLGANKYNNSFNEFRPAGRQICPHAVIGKCIDGIVRSYQILPWNIPGWHSGNGIKGNANYQGYIGVEICEDDLTDRLYFNQVYNEAVELFAYLCKEYKLNPTKDIICHCEGYKKGIASNHADVMHWFPKHGKNMDMFRTDVANKMRTGTPKPVTSPAKPQLPPPNYTNYVVKRGDGFWRIAKNVMRNPLRALELAKFNGLKITSTIHAGQTLRIPK